MKPISANPAIEPVEKEQPDTEQSAGETPRLRPPLQVLLHLLQFRALCHPVLVTKLNLIRRLRTEYA